MAAAVSSLVRRMNGVDSKDSASSAGKSTATIITMDLLGGCCIHDSKELDPDFKSGKVRPERCNSSNASSSNSGNNALSNETLPNFQDLDFHSPSKQMFDESSLDLKLVTPSSSPPNYQSVCTLDKVKSALARAGEEKLKKRAISMSRSSWSPPSNSSSSIKDNGDVDQDEKSSASFAAGCPCCLLYVLISKNNPKCPRCSSDVPLHVAATKKPRIDLNMAI